MKTRNLLLLICTAVVFAVLAAVTSKRNTISSPEAINIKLFSELPVNDITKITITSADSSVTLERKEDTWVCSSLFGYMANFERIKDAVLKIKDLKAGRKRSMKPDAMGKIKMRMPDDTSADSAGKGTLVRLFTDSGEEAASILVGAGRTKPESNRRASREEGRFISPDGGAGIYITYDRIESLDASDAHSWIDAELLAVNTFSITNIAINVPGEKPVNLSSIGQAPLMLGRLSRKEITNEDKASAVRYALSYLRLDDLADPALDDRTMGFDSASTFTAVTDQNEIYTVSIGGSPEGSSNRYVRISASMAEAPEKTDPAANTDPDSPQSDAVQRVESVNRKLGGWTYILAHQKVASMLCSRDELVSRKK